MIFRPVDGVAEVIRTATASIVSPAAQHNSRVPGGHPEGFIEAFANIYTDFAAAIAAKLENRPYQGMYPDVETGVRGMNFIETVVSSSKQNGAWVALKQL